MERVDFKKIGLFCLHIVPIWEYLEKPIKLTGSCRSTLITLAHELLKRYSGNLKSAEGGQSKRFLQIGL
jgi:hypothetical protein